MDYGVILYFDDRNSNYIDNLRNKVYDNRVNSHTIDSGIRPHITLASFECENISEFIDNLKDFLKNEKSFKVNFSSIGIFPFGKKVVYLSPVLDSNLSGIHQRFYESFDSEDLNYTVHYLPDNWVPHCTIASRLDFNEVTKAVTTLQDEFKPIKAMVKYIGVIQGDPVKELACIKL